MKTKLLIPLLALLLPRAAEAEILTGFCGAEGENISYTLDTESGELTLAGSGRMADYNEGSYNNRTPWGNGNLQRVVVGEGITHLGNDAFSYDSGSRLVSVTLPSTLVSIGGVQSNHTRQVAAVAAKLGLKVVSPAKLGRISASAYALLSWCPAAYRMIYRQGRDADWIIKGGGGGADFGVMAHWLLARYHRSTLLVLVGFIIGSLVKVWPWSDMETVREAQLLREGTLLEIDMQIPWAIVWALVGAALVTFLEIMAHRKAEK